MATRADFTEELASLERKWQERWDEAELFECDPSDDEKFYITVAYPYPNGGMHVGHIRTYMLPDVFARFKRMQGYNVLFPMGWHVTGTPIIGALSRIKEGDTEQIDLLENVYNVPEEVIEGFDEPMDLAEYFIDNSYRNNMMKLGFSVDWRREFTTNDRHYNKFIEWQYLRLRDEGLVERGLHPTKYCLHDQNPVTTHDLLRGEDAQRQEFTIVEFESQDFVIPTATLRPETTYGVTHLLVDPELTYHLVEVDGERWVVSPEAEVKLSHQDKDVERLREVEGSELVGATATNPVTDEEVPVLPASFVDPDAGTGLVMSVPAHAPYDWISLQDLKRDSEGLARYGVDPSVVESLEPRTIIDVEGYDDVPAKVACEEHGVESQRDEAALDAATEEVYQTEFNAGVMNEACGEFAGKPIKETRERLIETFEDAGVFDAIYDFTEEVVSKSGGKVIVSLQESWFLEYGDEEWKNLVARHIDRLEVIPEEKRQDYYDTVDWLESWPCIRNFGLGTRLPYDQDFVVEPLSDSTIYMAFYTISHIVEDVEPEKLAPEFFDYVFRGDGSLDAVVAETGLDEAVVEEARRSFEYWYPLDWRTTAYELIRNHLTFMLYHHAALFDEDDWVEGIATWGMVLLESQKMSTSKGHVIIAEEALDRFSADVIRFHLFASNEPWQDFNWSNDEARDRVRQLRRFRDRVLDLHGTGVERDPTLLDRYVLSRLQAIVEETTGALEEFQTRQGILGAFFALNDLVNRYQARADDLDADVVRELTRTQLKLMVPFVPHLSEELWAETGNEGFASAAEWPTPDPSLRDEAVERRVEFAESTVEDVRDLSNLVGEFSEIEIVLAADWKRDLFADLETILDERPSFGEAMGRLVEGRTERADVVQAALKKYLDEPDEFPSEVFTNEAEREALLAYREFVEREFDAEVVVVDETESAEERAGRAEPGQPAIIMR